MAFLIDPARSGRCRNHQIRTLKRPDALELRQRQLRTLLGRVGRPQTDINTQWLLGRAPRHGLNLRLIGTVGDHAPSLSAQGGPLQQGVGPTGFECRRGTWTLFLETRIEFAVAAIHHAQHALHQQAIAHIPEDQRGDQYRQQSSGRRGHASFEASCHRPLQAQKQTRQQQQQQEHRARHRSDRERPSAVDRRQVHQRPQSVLPFRRPPERTDDGRQTDQQQSAETPLPPAPGHLGPTKRAPQPAQQHPQPISHRKTQTAERPLHQRCARHQRGGERCGHEQRSQHHARATQRREKGLHPLLHGTDYNAKTGRRRRARRAALHRFHDSPERLLSNALERCQNINGLCAPQSSLMPVALMIGPQRLASARAMARNCSGVPASDSMP